MKNELISMVAFVLAQPSEIQNRITSFEAIHHYAVFLEEPLNISMFVPAIEVDGKWEVLEEPICYGIGDEQYFGSRMDEYQQAKDKVIFEGFEVKIGVVTDYATFNHSRGRTKIMLNNKTIQDLIKYKPTLTQKGVEVSGLNR